MTRELSCFNKPNFNEAAHVASASQIKTWQQCNLKWWFGKGPLRLPELDRGYYTFGTVLHAVCERWLGADDLGNDPKTGQPVELYPQGWESTLSRDKETMVSVSIAEQDLIKKLIAISIEDGILVRHPGRRLEQEFYLPVLDLGTEEGIVWIMGYIDVLLPDEVQDHKSTKNMKYAMSPKKLRADPQMLIYAMVVIQRCEETGAPVPSSITVRHNVFCKDPEKPRVKTTPAQVTPGEVETFLQEARYICGKMVGQLKIKDWHKVPNAEEGANPNACNAYGGCPFLPVCSGTETPKQYKIRVERVQRTRLESASGSKDNGNPKSKENGSMADGNLFAKKLAERKAAKAAVEGGGAPPASDAPPKTDGSEAPPAKPEPKPEPKPEIPSPEKTLAAATPPVAAPAQDTETPPWAVAECPACKGKGFNTQNSPCRICNSIQTKNGGLTSGMFDIYPIGDGTFAWEVKAEHADKVNAASGTATIPDVPATGTTETVVEKTETPAEPEVASEPPAETEDDDDDNLVPGETCVVWEFRGKPVWGRFQKYVKGGINAVRDGSDQVSKVLEGKYRLATEEDMNPEVENPDDPPATGQDLSGVVKPPKSRGRPQVGFTLCIGCLPTKIGGTNVINLDEVMDRYGKVLATEQGVESFYLLDDFKRRNALAYGAPSMVEEFGKSIVLVRGSSQDIRALTDALRPHAFAVYEGV